MSIVYAVCRIAAGFLAQMLRRRFPLVPTFVQSVALQDFLRMCDKIFQA